MGYISLEGVDMAATHSFLKRFCKFSYLQLSFDNAPAISEKCSLAGAVFPFAGVLADAPRPRGAKAA